MKVFIELSREIYTYVSSLLDRLCKANPKFTPSQISRDFNLRRNKMTMVIHAYMLVLLLLMELFGHKSKGTLILVLFSVWSMLGNYLSCRYHPQIFKASYTFMMIIYGPVMLHWGDGIAAAWVVVPLGSVFVYLFTDSIWYYMLEVSAQLFYMNILYQKPMEEAVACIGSKAFTSDLTLQTNFGIALCTNLVIMFHFSIQGAYQRLSFTEKKKNEYENQRTFLLGFSHELRNLINSLTGNVKLAGLENLNERAKELIQNAELCGELLLHLINNILDTGKVEIGELEMNPTPTRIYEAFERIWGICSELVRRKNLQCQMKIQNNLPPLIMMDHYRQTQVFLNLVGNAVKFTEERGHIDINVEWIPNLERVTEDCFKPYPFNDDDEKDEGLFEKRQAFRTFDEDIVTLTMNSRKVNTKLLKPTTNETRGVLKVVVRDSGCGMAKDEVDRLFQKFTQVNSNPSQRKLGTGLGLFITKQLVEKAKGEIRAYSKTGKGSAFISCIPFHCVKEENDYQNNTVALKEFLKNQHFQAMIVDDEPFNRKILSNFFDKLKINVLDVGVNGLMGYQKYEEYAKRGDYPHIVTMDLDMPIMDGKEAARRIRRFEAEKGIDPCVLIIISGNYTKTEIAECLDKSGQIRADGFLPKPASIEELLKVIGLGITKFRR